MGTQECRWRPGLHTRRAAKSRRERLGRRQVLTIKLTCRALCTGVASHENQYGGPVRCSAWFGGVPSTSDRDPQL